MGKIQRSIKRGIWFDFTANSQVGNNKNVSLTAQTTDICIFGVQNVLTQSEALTSFVTADNVKLLNSANTPDKNEGEGAVSSVLRKLWCCVGGRFLQNNLVLSTELII